MILYWNSVLANHASTLFIQLLRYFQHVEQQKGQVARLEELRSSLLSYNVALDIEFSQTLHDREIR